MSLDFIMGAIFCSDYNETENCANSLVFGNIYALLPLIILNIVTNILILVIFVLLNSATSFFPNNLLKTAFSYQSYFEYIVIAIYILFSYLSHNKVLNFVIFFLFALF